MGLKQTLRISGFVALAIALIVTVVMGIYLVGQFQEDQRAGQAQRAEQVHAEQVRAEQVQREIGRLRLPMTQTEAAWNAYLRRPTEETLAAAKEKLAAMITHIELANARVGRPFPTELTSLNARVDVVKRKIKNTNPEKLAASKQRKKSAASQRRTGYERSSSTNVVIDFESLVNDASNYSQRISDAFAENSRLAYSVGTGTIQQRRAKYRELERHFHHIEFLFQTLSSKVTAIENHPDFQSKSSALRLAMRTQFSNLEADVNRIRRLMRQVEEELW